MTEHFVGRAEAPEHEAAEVARRLEWAYDGYATVAFGGLPAPPRLNVRLFRDATRFDAFVGAGQTFYLSLEGGLDVDDRPLLVSYVFPRLQGPRTPMVQMALAAFLTARGMRPAPAVAIDVAKIGRPAVPLVRRCT